MKLKRNININIVLLVCCLLALCCAGCDETDGPAAAEQSRFSKTIERGPFSLTVVLESDHVSIAETLSLELLAKSAEGFKVRFPELDSPDNAIEDLELIETVRLDDRLGENNNVISAIRYRFEPFVTGNLQIPPMPVVFYNADDAERVTEIVTEAVDIQIDSVLNLPALISVTTTPLSRRRCSIVCTVV